MSEYCIPRDVRDRAATITPALYSEGVLLSFIIRQSSRIDSALRKRYVVPLVAPWDDIVTQICADLVAAQCLAVMNQGDSTEQPSAATAIRKQALDDLKALTMRDPRTGEYPMSLSSVELTTMAVSNCHHGDLYDSTIEWAADRQNQFAEGREHIWRFASDLGIGF